MSAAIESGAAISGFWWVGIAVAAGLVVVTSVWAVRRAKHKGDGGNQPPFLVVASNDTALQAVLAYLAYYQQLYDRRRNTVKSRAKAAVVATAIANGTIAVVGAVVTFTHFSGLAIASTALAGVVAVIAAWDGHFRHRDLWVQRSLVLHQIEELLRDTDIRKRAAFVDEDKLAKGTLAALDRILQEDIDNWGNIRTSGESERPKSSADAPDVPGELTSEDPAADVSLDEKFDDPADEEPGSK